MYARPVGHESVSGFVVRCSGDGVMNGFVTEFVDLDSGDWCLDDSPGDDAEELVSDGRVGESGSWDVSIGFSDSYRE